MKSDLPLILQYLQALTVPALALFGAYLGWRQYRLSKEKVRLDLFDKRLRVFEHSMEFAEQVLSDEYPPDVDVSLIKKAVAGAEFLFGDEVILLLQKIDKQATTIEKLEHKIDKPDYPERHTDYEQLQKDCAAFRDMKASLVGAFRKYMNFSEFQN